MRNNHLTQLKTIFIDDGGTMNDNSKRGEQWKDLIAKYFVPLYGGKPDEWREANQQVVDILISKVNQLIGNGINLDYNKYQVFEDEVFINHMFDTVDIKRPAEHEYFEICRQVEKWVTPQIQAEIEGIIDVIRRLNADGFTLHTASGETSWVLRGYLTGMGIIDCFTNLYGPDLVGVMKGGLDFYRRIFVHAQVNPSQVIVVDDNPKLLRLAGQLGAHTIQSCTIKESAPRGDYYFNDPAELPEIIKIISNEKI